MFQNLSDKILGSLKKIKGGQKITESNIEDVIKEIRMSLLDADVNFKVVKKFIDEVKSKSLGQKVIETVNPGQMFVKIIHDELVRTLGTEAIELNLSQTPTVLFLVGLQGAGKTTSAAKLALYLRTKKEKKVMIM